MLLFLLCILLDNISFDSDFSSSNPYKIFEISPSLAESSHELFSIWTWSLTMFYKLSIHFSSSLKRNCVFLENFALGIYPEATINLMDRFMVLSQSSSTVSFFKKAWKLIFILILIIWYFVKILRITTISYSRQIFVFSKSFILSFAA